ncbi:MAG: NAD(P)-dependent alcohol dehydrogenase [Proteobacteria bacterium]|nr:NAD(P)-dependent alcohol dehydrogenase [Pseudomonadota bacterium]
MKTWRVAAGSGIEGLKTQTEPPAALGPTSVRVRLRAATLNYRDLMVLKGWYPVSGTGPLVPGSDGAGDVIETGSAVTRFKVGDRVTTCFFPDWIEGRMSLPRIATALGAGGAGTLAEEVVLDERSLVATPAHLDYAQAASLTCAGVTAWNALFETGGLKPGQTVLLLGTGGVSIWALQLARAAGVRAIITSSSDAKLERARSLGADALINYTKNPEWSGEVRKLTGGEGVDVVMEVGGEKTAQQSLASVRMQGTVVIIGGVSGFGGAINPRSLIVGATRVQGVYVGSRQMHEDLARFVSGSKIAPVVDKVFAFGEAPEAYRHFEAGRHFGKVGVALV